MEDERNNMIYGMKRLKSGGQIHLRTCVYVVTWGTETQWQGGTKHSYKTVY